MTRIDCIPGNDAVWYSPETCQLTVGLAERLGIEVSNLSRPLVENFVDTLISPSCAWRHNRIGTFCLESNFILHLHKRTTKYLVA